MEYTTGELTVGGRDHGQFTIYSYSDLENWDRDYFSISGYFGSYGPDLFAAAPDLYEALELVVAFGVDETSRGTAIAALSKARGETQ